MIRAFSGMTEKDHGGDLWRTLSKEEDLLQGVLLQLDPVSLVNLEMVCVNFREFMQRTQTWKKKFELSDQVLKNHVKDTSESDHIQYKRRCLKLLNLQVNLKHGHCRKTKTELPKVFGNYNSGLFNHSLKAMHPDLVFVEGILRDLENSLVFDVREGWQPLCDFLDVPVPEEPFPRGNDTQEMMVRLRAMKRNSLMLWTLTLMAGTGSLGYFLYKK